MTVVFGDSQRFYLEDWDATPRSAGRAARKLARRSLLIDAEGWCGTGRKKKSG
jgi:hypothetical protein